MLIDPVITGFGTNEVRSHLQICDKSIINFGNKFFLGFSNTYHIDSLDRTRKSVVDKFKFDIIILKKQEHS